MDYEVDRRPDAPFTDAIGDLPADASDAWWEYRRVCGERASRGDACPPHEAAVYDAIISLMWERMFDDERLAESDAAAFDVSDVLDADADDAGEPPQAAPVDAEAASADAGAEAEADDDDWDDAVALGTLDDD
jgi:hypothetical protein